LLDRIDLHVEVLRPTTDTLRQAAKTSESSAVVRARVAASWQIQMQRSGANNARLSGEQLELACTADDACWSLLESAAQRFNLSARAHQRVLRVARTIADLAGEERIAAPHIAEALSLRCLDRQP
jgi:magnesium chelatase family protein